MCKNLHIARDEIRIIDARRFEAMEDEKIGVCLLVSLKGFFSCSSSFPCQVFGRWNGNQG